MRATNDHVTSKEVVNFSVQILRLMWKTKANYNEEINTL